MSSGTEIDQLRGVLRQHARTLMLMGVDFLPVSRVTTIALDSTPQIPTPPLEARPQALPVLDAVVEPKPPSAPLDADRAAAAALLERLRARYEADSPHDRFVTDHHCIVFGEGDPRARLMFVGEAPGAEEDKCGRPFVGRAGQLLDKMIVAMGLAREQVYITNVLKTRPPNNATPTIEEAALCAPYLFEQIAIVRPQVIVTLGLPATRTLLSTAESMGRLRGQWHDLALKCTLGIAPTSSAPVPVMPTYHPAFLLRAYTTDNRQKVWSDLRMAADRLGLPARPKGATTAA